MSASFKIGIKILRFLGSFKSSDKLFLPLLSKEKDTLCSPHWGLDNLISSPTPGFSILITSAPVSDKNKLASGPGKRVEKSITFMPSKDPFNTSFIMNS